MMTADYSEILRLYRKYSTRDGEGLWEVFVRIGRELERSVKKPRCPSCLYTVAELQRLSDLYGHQATADVLRLVGGARGD